MRPPARILLVALLALAVGGSARPVREVDPKITGIRAHVFYHDRGTISDDILAREDMGMNNGRDFVADTNGVGFGGMLVVVEVSGEPKSYPTRRVEIAVRDWKAKKEILRRQAGIYGLNAEGKTYAAFFVPDAGCAPLEISAALLGQKDPSRKTADVGFHCGE